MLPYEVEKEVVPPLESPLRYVARDDPLKTWVATCLVPVVTDVGPLTIFGLASNE